MGALLANNTRPVIEELTGAAELGKVVYDRRPPDPQGMVFMLKHVHGDASMAQNAVAHPAYGQVFFQHQNATLQALHAIADPRHDHLLLCLEGVRREEERQWLASRLEWETPEFSAKVESNCAAAAADPQAAASFFSYVRHLLEEGEIKRAQTLIYRYSGGTRFLMSTALTGRSWEGHLYGMQTDERNAFGELDASGKPWAARIEVCRNDFRLMHMQLTERISQDVQPGHCALVVLGSGHFKSGSQCASELRIGRIQALQPYLLEGYLEDNRALARSRCVVFEPNHLSELINYPG